MKLQMKKALAMLAAGAMLTGTAAAYAAQLPAQAPAASPVSTSSDTSSYDPLRSCVSIQNYTLTSNQFHAYFSCEIRGGDPSGYYQSRYTTYYVNIQREIGVGSQCFETVFSGSVSGYPKGLSIDQAITINPGERLYVSISTSAEAFNGYNYAGKIYGFDEFYLTL